MIISTINFKQLEDRIDAEYYQPEYLSAIDRILRFKNYKSLGELTSKIVNGVEIRDYYKRGKPYLRVSDIKELFMDLSDVKRILESSEITKDVELKDGDLLSSRSGTIGVTAMVNKELEGSVISSHLIRIVPRNINSYYLGIFLNCKFGKNQILQKNNGAVVPEINQPSLKSVKIPIPPQSFQLQIEKMVKESHEKRKLADEKYKEAEKVLNKELGIEDLDLSTQKTFVARFSDLVVQFHPSVFQPKYYRALKTLNKNKTIKIREILKEVQYGTSEDLFYTDDGIPFLRVTDIDKYFTINPKDGKFISHYDADRLKEYKVQKGDILISRTGTLGSAIYIDERLQDSIFGSYFIKIHVKSKQLNSEFITFFLNSKLGKLQSEKLSSGGIQTNLTIDAIKSLIVPVVSQSIQQKISQLIQESFVLRKQSKNLINVAKRKIEEMIEKEK